MRLRNKDTIQGRHRTQYPNFDIIPASGGYDLFGKQKIGEADITFCYQGRRSSWGLWNNQKASILHFETNRKESRGYRLRELNVQVTFFDEVPGANPSPATTSVRIEGRPSPAFLWGGETVRNKDKETHIEPTVEAADVSASLGHYQSRSNYVETRHWAIESYCTGAKGSLTTAGWIFSANEHQKDRDSAGCIHGGIVLTHKGQPFYAHCTISGSLFKQGTRFKEFFKLSSPKPEDIEYFRIAPSSDTDDLADLIEELETKVCLLVKQSSASKLE
ncbi:MAG: hypothetical protein GOMPHAMPRED_006074 [Gomphillus americanus]|uniref:Uncharacterized protein n=1 Tax=Gomphillus americanus TaxID=1940652 RepID=A0A8H3I9E1_9LECA|nr:MAG: hypothetical protein GOMPHAMPRED_006074 [Gomphillus americanus]